MLSNTIFVLTTIALAVSGSPTVYRRNTPAQGIQQQCGNNLKASCCNSVVKEVFGLIGVNVGIDCTTLNLLSVLPVDQLCNQEVACCESGAQDGLVNVGNVCPIINL
ncbi:hypothetical protein MMC34_000449 [Xylographa carneopallida]|nr:hypothetical protein [Xylographa carneopallida]